MGTSYVALDLETTDLDTESDEIIEMGAIRFDAEGVLDRFETLVNPEYRKNKASLHASPPAAGGGSRAFEPYILPMPCRDFEVVYTSLGILGETAAAAG